jgi:hypothetical protein
MRAWLLLLGIGCSLCASAPVLAQTSSRMPTAYRPSLMGDELSELERQRAELSLGGPIATTIIGGVIAVTGASFLLVGALIATLPSSCDQTNDNDYFGDDFCSEPDSTPFIIIGVAGLVAGAVILAVALPWLFDRIGERRALGLRIKELRRQRSGGGAFLWGDGPRLARSAPLFKLRF